MIDPAGKTNFFKAIGVASQVFNTLTEVIQGPCVGNQQTLAHSRLWDAVGGFLFLFAHMQEKLSKNSTQVDLLQELLNLQKDLIVMLLSMLEGENKIVVQYFSFLAVQFNRLAFFCQVMSSMAPSGNRWWTHWWSRQEMLRCSNKKK